ncbi:MAG: DUF2892 domain-containing protein [Rubellimicrobium sp.]|nr:DUF2892 domain-containing protein [Rubellimicrobium sp.]
MFTINEGKADRIIRVVIGAALLIWFFVDSTTGFWHWIKLIGILPLVTGAVGHCGLYSLLGINTCPTKPK